MSGPRHQVGLGIRGEELGVLEEVLGVSETKRLSFRVAILAVIGSGSWRFDGSVLGVEELGVPGFGPVSAIRVHDEDLDNPRGSGVDDL